MRIAYFDCFSGASGDMLVGSLIDAGADFSKVRREIEKLGLEGAELSVREVRRGILRASKFDVRVAAGPSQPRRGLSDIIGLVESSGIPARAKQRAGQVFRKLAEAESRVHGVAVSEVHFHEVGAVDSIVDIAGACVALELLDVEKLYSSPVVVGTGEVESAHGRLPVPAPATAELLKGKPVRQSCIRAELTTPTGAAFLSALAADFCEMPEFKIESVGYGAGQREIEGQPNVLRVFIGEEHAVFERDWVWEVQTNIDDMSPEVCGYLVERLLGAGALDVFITPVVMKKSRPGQLITVLAAPAALCEIEETIFSETTTLGIRRRRMERRKLRREEVEVKTRYGLVRGKVGRSDEREYFFSPEYESAKAVAAEAGVALREVMDEARAEFRKRSAADEPR